jgi:hypothetical protein
MIFISLNSTSASCTFGQYVSSSGCYKCGGGSYCSNQNGCSNYCTSCPSPLMSNYDGAVECTDANTQLCFPGSGKLASGQGCYPCPAGTYQDGTMLTCQPCTGNSVSSTGATSCTSTCAFGSRDGAGGLGVCRYIVLFYYLIICLHM